MINFSSTLRKILIDKKLAHGDLAEQLGMSKQVFSDFVNRRKDYRVNADIERIADALGYDVKLQFVDRQTGKVIDCD